MPEISVLMSVYNTDNNFLRESIESILEQSFTNFEFIIIDDMTNESNKSILREYEKKDSRILVIHNETNMGLTRSLNRGLKLAKGKYLARMDADDVSVKDRLKKQYEYMKINEDVIVIGGLATILGTKKIAMKPVKIFEVLRMRMIFFDCAMIHPTAFINMKLLNKHNLYYDESIKKSQDYMLWSDCMMRGRISVINEVVLHYRVHNDQITSMYSSDQKKYSMTIQNKIIKTYFGTQLDEESLELHYDIIYGRVNGRLDRIRKHFSWLMDLNKSCNVFNKNSFKRECYYIWLLMVIKSIVYDKDVSPLKSIMTAKVLLSIRYWPYYLKYMIV